MNNQADILTQTQSVVHPDGEFTVLQGMDGDGLDNTIDIISPDETNEQAWNERRIHHVTQEAAEWLQSLSQQQQQQRQRQQNGLHKNCDSAVPILSTISHRWWLHQARLRLFTRLPAKGGEPTPEDDDDDEEEEDEANPETLSPGSTVRGVALHTFEKQTGGNSATLLMMNKGQCFLRECGAGGLLPEPHRPKAGRLQYLQLAAATNSDGGDGTTRFVVFSVDGYTLLLPATHRSSNDLNHYDGSCCWWWRVTCAAGAVVRYTSDLKNSPIVATLPYGSQVLVTKKIINRQGLARLYIRATAIVNNNNNNNNHHHHYYNNDKTIITGWCSQYLNPLSGLQGPILQPLPFSRPILYRVILPTGAVVRRQAELNSPVVPPTLPYNSLISVSGRCFSEFPASNCVPRLRLAESAAYASICLVNNNNNNNNNSNHGAQSATTVLQATDRFDPSFDPERPWLFHCQIYSKYSLGNNITTMIPTTTTTLAAATLSPMSPRQRHFSHVEDPICVCCLEKTANATLIHAGDDDTGHICCCLQCARLCQANTGTCPLCRKNIAKVILHFYA